MIENTNSEAKILTNNAKNMQSSMIAVDKTLNASIEAARAGEAGKGFSVVAEQIQELAEQSTNSSEDIASVLSNLNSNSNNSVNTMKKVRNVINKQSKDIEKTKEIFNSDYAKEFFDVDYINTLLDEHHKGNAANGKKIYVIFVFLTWYKRFFIDEVNS